MSGTNGITNLQNLTPQVAPASAAAPTGKEQQIKTVAAPALAVARANHAIDQANISSTSSLISAALSGSDVRLDRIQPIQDAIANGTYNVSSSDVADKLISSLLR